ncbi:MAG: DUF4058 family protein [Chloroflexota bacterium]
MPSPFPGMDPYIEQPEVWRDFHNNLAIEIQARLNEKLGPRYYAAIEPRIAYEVVEVATKYGGQPDVGVLRLREAPTVAPAAPNSPVPVKSRVPLEFPVRLLSTRIRTVGEHTLVTSIEILSPVNKQRGHEAFKSYRRKRRALLRSEAHLIEVDLLRRGERPPLAEPVPSAPYYVTLSRVEDRPTVQVWPIQLKDELPVIPVPLLEPDPDASLDLNAVVAAIYKRGAYAVRIDYRQPPPPPELSPEEQAWAESLLKREKQNA